MSTWDIPSQSEMRNFFVVATSSKLQVEGLTMAGKDKTSKVQNDNDKGEGLAPVGAMQLLI